MMIDREKHEECSRIEIKGQEIRDKMHIT